MKEVYLSLPLTSSIVSAIPQGEQSDSVQVFFLGQAEEKNHIMFVL
jgi:hypothetical protein